MPEFQVKAEVGGWEKQLLTPYVHTVAYSHITLMHGTLREQEQRLDSYAVMFFPEENRDVELERLHALRHYLKRRVCLAAQNACKYLSAV